LGFVEFGRFHWVVGSSGGSCWRLTDSGGILVGSGRFWWALVGCGGLCCGSDS
jgi:hypothetical protein